MKSRLSGRNLAKWKVRRNEHQSTDDTEIHAVQTELQRRSESADTADAEQRTDLADTVRSGGASSTADTRYALILRPEMMHK